jgi:hypothetical protein
MEESDMRKRVSVLLSALLTAVVSLQPALAHERHRYHHGPDHPGLRLGVYVGYVWPGPYYYYPPYYPPYSPLVVVRPQPQIYYIERAAPQAASAAGALWYFCRATGSYYPYVRECPGGWEQVVPTPPPN